MTVIWTAGQAVTGAGSATVLGTWLRVNLSAVPAYLGHTAGTPSLYYDTGYAGWKSDAFYAPGTLLKALQTVIEVPASIATEVWWNLDTGVAATIYQGREIDVGQAVAARVFNSGAQTLATGTPTALAFDTVRYDPWGMWASGSNTRLTCKVPGVYAIGACIGWALNAVGSRAIRFRVNGVTSIGRGVEPATTGGADNPYVVANCHYLLNVGDYVEVLGSQTSGGNLDTLVSANSSPEFWMALLPG